MSPVVELVMHLSQRNFGASRKAAARSQYNMGRRTFNMGMISQSGGPQGPKKFANKVHHERQMSQHFQVPDQVTLRVQKNRTQTEKQMDENNSFEDENIGEFQNDEIYEEERVSNADNIKRFNTRISQRDYRPNPANLQLDSGEFKFGKSKSLHNHSIRFGQDSGRFQNVKSPAV